MAYLQYDDRTSYMCTLGHVINKKYVCAVARDVQGKVQTVFHNLLVVCFHFCAHCVVWCIFFVFLVLLIPKVYLKEVWRL